MTKYVFFDMFIVSLLLKTLQVTSMICIHQSLLRTFFIKFFRFFSKPFPSKLWLLRVCSTSLLKILWKKEKLLIRSTISFSDSVFYPFGELSVSSKLKLSSANSFTLKESKICRLGKG